MQALLWGLSSPIKVIDGIDLSHLLVLLSLHLAGVPESGILWGQSAVMCP